MDEEKRPIEPQTTAAFFQSISDPQKLEIIRQIAESMEPSALQEIINVIGAKHSAAGGEVTINISCDGQTVRMDFGKALAWLTMPKAHAVQLAIQLLQAGGAKIQPPASPGAAANDVIDIKP